MMFGHFGSVVILICQFMSAFGGCLSYVVIFNKVVPNLLNFSLPTENISNETIFSLLLGFSLYFYCYKQDVNVINAQKNTDGSLGHSVQKGDKENSMYLKSKAGLAIGGVGGAVAGGVAGLAIAGAEAASGAGIAAMIGAGAAAGASVFALPVVAGAVGIGLLGSGAGYLISKLFD